MRSILRPAVVSFVLLGLAGCGGPAGDPVMVGDPTPEQEKQIEEQLKAQRAKEPPPPAPAP